MRKTPRGPADLRIGRGFSLSAKNGEVNQCLITRTTTSVTITELGIKERKEHVTMDDTQDTLWIEVYDGEGDDAKLIFEGTARQWEIFRTTHHWGIPKEIPSEKAEDN